MSTAEYISLEVLQEPPHPIRTRMDAKKFNALVESIRTRGVLQALRVKQHGDSYEIICGHRRYIAAMEAGLTKVPCIIVSTAQDKAIGESYHENAFREDLSDHEEALLFQHLTDIAKMTVSQISTDYNRGQDYIQRRLALLTFPDEIIEEVKKGLITLGIAAEIAKVKDDTTRLVYLDQAITQQAPLKRVRVWVGNWLAANDPDEYERQAELYDKPTNIPPTIDCDFCGTNVPIEKTIPLRMCNNCRIKLRVKIAEAESPQTKEPTTPTTPEKNGT